MRILLAIQSCHRDRGCHEQIRDTWMGLNNGAIDIKFFLGNPKGEAAADEIFLDVPDDLHSLSLKTLGMIVWTLEHGYDHSFKGDTDTYICIPRLLASGFEKHDYSGCVQGLDQGRIDAVYGGTGYWLSRRAMEARTPSCR